MPHLDLERKICHTQPVDKHEGTLLENRACTTLCELSDNICGEEQPATPHLVTQYSCSPWRKHRPNEPATQPTRTRPKLANKENCSHQTKVLKKGPSVAVAVRKDHPIHSTHFPNHHQQDQGITIVTILTRKRSKLSQLQQQRTELIR